MIMQTIFFFFFFFFLNILIGCIIVLCIFIILCELHCSVGFVSVNPETIIIPNFSFWPNWWCIFTYIWYNFQCHIKLCNDFAVTQIQTTVKPVLCGLCHERSLVLNYRFIGTYVYMGRIWFSYLLWETNCLERLFLLGRRGGLTRQVLLYICQHCQISIKILIDIHSGKVINEYLCYLSESVLFRLIPSFRGHLARFVMWPPSH